MNHQAHFEATRSMKIVEANLKGKIDELQSGNEKIETELRRYVDTTLYHTKHF